MSKPARGSKRVCQNCGARFYDLSRTPIVCPVCQTVYQVVPPPSRRSERAAPPEPRVAVAPVTNKAVIEPIAVISLEEAEDTGEDIAIEEDEEIVDLGEDEAVIPAGGDEDTFLEETEGDEGTDVSGIVGGTEKGEEG